MTDRSKGLGRVRSAEAKFHGLGFRTMTASASGQNRGKRHGGLALDGDMIAIAPDGSSWPHFIVEIGGKSKSVRLSLSEMTLHPIPAGFTPLVVRLTDGRRRLWRWHLDSHDAFDTLGELLAAVAAN